MDESVIAVLKARLQEFRHELLQTAESVGEPQRVVQINFQLFPLSRTFERET